MKMKIKLLGIIALFLIGHIGVVNAVTPVAPGGATLDALASGGCPIFCVSDG